jgi:hypothetical protein
MMNPDESTSTTAPEPPSGLAAKANGGLTGSTGAAPVASSRIRTWALALAAGLAVGVIAWALGEAALIPDSGLARRQVARGNIDPLASAVGLRNAVVSFGTLGAAMGLGLGVAGGLIRRSVVRAVLAGATGLILGGLTGVGMARLLVPVYYENLSANDLTYPLIVHGGTWGPVGAAAGLAFALGLGGWGRMLRAAVGGACAALLAAAVYEIAGGILVPGAMTNLPVSAIWQTRLAAQLLVTLLVAAGVVLVAGFDGGAQGSGGATDQKDKASHSGGLATSG